MPDALIFNVEMLPEEERETAYAVRSNLSSMDMIVTQFESALKLFDFAESEFVRLADAGELSLEDDLARVEHNRLMASWNMIAARFGAITIYELYQLFQTIDTLTAACPTVAGMIDTEARKRAARMFAASFPDFAPTRNFAAHGSEMTAHPDDAKRHTATELDIPEILMGEGSSALISGCLFGRKFSSTYNGRVVSYELSQDTLAVLREIVRERVATFEPVSRITHERGREEWLRKRSRPPQD